MNSCIHTGRSSFNSGKTRSNPTLGNARGNDFSWAKTEKDRIKPNNNAKLLENIAANSFASEKFTRNDFSHTASGGCLAAEVAMVGEFALEFGEFAMLFVFDEPDVVLQPESKEEAFEVWRADPGPGGVIVRIVGSLVGDFFFVVH